MNDSIRVGDRVVIKETLALADRSFIGREGVVGVVDAASFVVEVRNLHSEGFTDVIASEVVKASENHDWRDEASELDRRRTQAAEFAHRILGADALLEDVIGLADWALAEPVKAEALTQEQMDILSGVANLSPIVAETPRPPADLRIKDTYGDAVHFRCVTDRPDTVAFIVGAPAGTYVTTDDADRIIAFLQDAKAARNT